MGSFSRRDNYFEKGFEYPADFAELEAMKLGTND